MGLTEFLIRRFFIHSVDSVWTGSVTNWMFITGQQLRSSSSRLELSKANMTSSDVGPSCLGRPEVRCFTYSSVYAMSTTPTS